ncbi:hypothetical protein [Streptomyces cupreus]|uniref:Uncharacterized protein n=1 Tax=Streptomyces cupreus TaxID=2759956 RepID=A0A7X1JFS4_9ACTN|nr:hypothetical protein [Streptomyces cupreus]MBC2907212.1 hypothetical protein [Streptomyces cupreus]
MDLRGRKLKFTAVTALVVLALTGFSSGRGHGGGSGDGDSGGGCSSSSQNHDSSTSRHDDDDDSGSSGSGSAEATQDATVELVSCATEESPYATVEVTNPNGTSADVTVVVHFLDARSSVVDMQTVDELVPANETVQVQLDLTDAAKATQVDHCEAELMPSV